MTTFHAPRSDRRRAFQLFTRLAAALLIVVQPCLLQAAEIFTVDSNESWLTIFGDIEGLFPINEQVPGSLTSSVSGWLFADVLPNWLTIAGADLIPADQPGLYEPNNAPAQFAAQTTVLPGVDAWAAIRNASATVWNWGTPINPGGTFNAGDMSLAFSTGTLDYSIPLLGVNQFDTLSFLGSIPNVPASPGTVTFAGGLATITLPVYAETSTVTEFGFTLNIGIEGQIVATGPAAPQPLAITSPGAGFSVGLGELGNLFNPDMGVGFVRHADNYDPIAPGTPREGWGVSAGVASGIVDPQHFGTYNVVQTSATSDGTQATVSTKLTDNGIDDLLTIDQQYTFAAENVLKIDVTVTNVSSENQDVRFSRQVDWDVHPTEFFEVIDTSPFAHPVLDATYLGFETPDPLGWIQTTGPAGGEFGPGDLGAGFIVDLGQLVPGQSRTFTLYHAISDLGQDADALRAQLDSLANFQWLAIGRDSALFGNAAALGLAVVPEPSTWLLGLMGAAAMVLVARKRAKPAQR